MSQGGDLVTRLAAAVIIAMVLVAQMPAASAVATQPLGKKPGNNMLSQEPGTDMPAQKSGKGVGQAPAAAASYARMLYWVAEGRFVGLWQCPGRGWLLQLALQLVQ